MQNVKAALIVAACLSPGATGLPAPGDDSVVARSLLRRDRPLNPAETQFVLAASFGAMADRKFRITPMKNTGAPDNVIDVQMYNDGKPRFLRHDGGSVLGSIVSFAEYTRQGAVSCEGHRSLGGELVIGYLTASAEQVSILGRQNPLWDGWSDDGLGAKATVGARMRSSNDLLEDVFDLYTKPAGSRFGSPFELDGRLVRPLVRHLELRPGDYSATPIPADTEEWLLINVETLLIRRWEIRDAGVSREYGWEFTPDSSLDFTPPNALTPPTCVSQKQ